MPTVTIIEPPQDGATVPDPSNFFGTFVMDSSREYVTGVATQIDGGVLVACNFNAEAGGWGPVVVSGLAAGGHRFGVFVSSNLGIGQAYRDFTV